MWIQSTQLTPPAHAAPAQACRTSQPISASTCTPRLTASLALQTCSQRESHHTWINPAATRTPRPPIRRCRSLSTTSGCPNRGGAGRQTRARAPPARERKRVRAKHTAALLCLLAVPLASPHTLGNAALSSSSNTESLPPCLHSSTPPLRPPRFFQQATYSTFTASTRRTTE